MKDKLKWKYDETHQVWWCCDEEELKFTIRKDSDFDGFVSLHCQYPRDKEKFISCFKLVKNAKKVSHLMSFG